MMMIAPNSLVRQKKRVQGEEEEEAVDRRKRVQTETPTPGADVRGVRRVEQEKIWTVV